MIHYSVQISFAPGTYDNSFDFMIPNAKDVYLRRMYAACYDDDTSLSGKVFYLGAYAILSLSPNDVLGEAVNYIAPGPATSNFNLGYPFCTDSQDWNGRMFIKPGVHLTARIIATIPPAYAMVGVGIGSIGMVFEIGGIDDSGKLDPIDFGSSKDTPGFISNRLLMY